MNGLDNLAKYGVDGDEEPFKFGRRVCGACYTPMTKVLLRSRGGVLTEVTTAIMAAVRAAADLKVSQ